MTGSLPYVLPFLTFLVFLALDGRIGLSPAADYTLRVVMLSAVLWFGSRKVITLRVRHWAGSLALGLLTFAVWIAPDLIAPGWRQTALFHNFLIGSAAAPAGGYATLSAAALSFRALRAVVLVPIIEELFWRAWLMRWLIRPDFLSVPLGAFTVQSFWITAVLFAAEHGTYWDVGLAAGILYNWWMVRTKSLGDCIFVHAVTNAALSAYVLLSGNWQYW
ncbi:MAG: CAAX prenyl protease-related protein [Bryobacterales bacterium]|nr:CAAX prenyl protease-related protein [Bryobacterales bacterium]